ncbi:MAG: hypothetical protein AAF744_03200 [Pseudomonadota bacterium]
MEKWQKGCELASMARDGTFALLRQTRAGHAFWRVMPLGQLAKHEAAEVLKESQSRLIRSRNAAISTDMLIASDWRDLEGRLAGKGFVLEPGPNSLELRDRAQGTLLGELATLGLPLAATERRLGAYPGLPPRKSEALTRP